MKKIVPPTCDSCKATAHYESELGVQFCYQCLFASAGFLSKHSLLESNVLCEVLFDGVWRTTDSTYEVWHRSQDNDNACGSVWIPRLVKNM